MNFVFLDFLRQTAKEAKIQEIWSSREGIEVCVRENEAYKFFFFLNHTQETVEMTMEQGGYSLLENREYYAGERAV